MWMFDTDFAEELFVRCADNPRPSQEELSAYSGDTMRFNVDNGVAHFAITGVLTKAPDEFLRWLGYENTTYGEIIAAVARLNDDPRVKHAVVAIDSPGGEVTSVLYDAIDAIKNSKKPITGIINDVSASACYALSAQCTKLIARNNAVRAGSIGVVRRHYASSQIIEITSSKAPLKRPDANTEEGRAAIVADLDKMHEMFAGAIANGRGTTIEKVNSDYGQGGMLLAQEALDRGMIDAIGVEQLKTVHKETTAMDLAQLRAEHPDLYNQAVSEGVEKGIAQERDRVNAIVALGEPIKATELALDHIKKGSSLTATVQAEFMAAAMTAAQAAGRTDEGSNAADATDNANTDHNASENEDGDDFNALLDAYIGGEA